MSGITLEQAKSKLSTWLKAEEKIASSQSYTINGRSLTRADLSEIRKTIDYWEGKVKVLSGASRRGISYANFN